MRLVLLCGMHEAPKVRKIKISEAKRRANATYYQKNRDRLKAAEARRWRLKNWGSEE